MANESQPWLNDPVVSQPAATSATPWENDPVVQQQLPEFVNLIPAGAELAGGLPSFFGFSKKAPPGKLQVSAWQADKLKNAMAIAQDEGQQMDIIRKVLPEVSFSRNDGGEIVVSVQGKQAVLNRKGFSAQDVVTGTTQATTAALAATPAGAIASLPLRAAAVGTLVGGSSAAQDLAANVMGAEKVVDLPRAGTAALTGAAFQYGLDKLVAPAVAGVYRWITGGGARGLYDRATGRLTQAGINLLQRAGAQVDEISDDLARAFAQQASRAANPDEALRMAQAQTLPVPVQPTRGQVTGRPGDQMTEDMMLKGAYGQPASDVMRAAEQRQQEALRANVPALQERLGGEAIEAGQGASAAQRALVTQAQTEKAASDVAFETAKAASAAVSKGTALQGVRAVRSAIAGDHELSGLARTTTFLGRLDDIINQAGDDINSQVTINALFDWRKQANSAARSNVGNEEGVALSKGIKAFDRWIAGAVDDALVQGDDAAVSLWKKAINQYREYAGRFKGGDLVEALTSRSPRSGQMQLDVDPADAARYIFNADSTSWISKRDLSRDLRQMAELLGPRSREWNAIRQEAFLKFARAAEGKMEGGSAQFAGAKFKKAWDAALRDNPELMSVLFGPSERRLIQQFADVAARVTNPVRGGQNFSNTASALSNLVQGIGGRLGARVQAFLNELPLAGPISQGARAVQAVGRTRGAPRPFRPTSTPAAGAGAAIYNSDGE